MTCVEPCEQPWLESTGVEVLRKRVEVLDSQFFLCVERNDVLFIDSSHVIRPQGDVVFQYLSILPSLQNGVIVHVHDIFTPRDYPSEWLRKEIRLSTCWRHPDLLLPGTKTRGNTVKEFGVVGIRSKEARQVMA